MIESLIKNKRGNQNQEPYFHQQVADVPLGSQLHSMDGIDQQNKLHFMTKQDPETIHYIKLQQKFLRLLSRIITEQNLNTRQGPPYFLPYQNQQIYVQLGSEIKITPKKGPNPVKVISNLHQLPPLKSCNLSSINIEQALQDYNDLKVINSMDDCRLQFQQNKLPYPQPYESLNMIYNTPRPYMQPQSHQNVQISNFISPLTSFVPIMNSQSFDPFMIRGTARDSMFGNMERYSHIHRSIEGQQRLLVEQSQQLKKDVKNEQVATSYHQKPPEVEDIPQVKEEPKKAQSAMSNQNGRRTKKNYNEGDYEDSSFEEPPSPQVKKERSRKNKIRKLKNDDLSDSFKVTERRKSSKLNDTKNITKNFSKAIISYIVQNKDIGMQILNQESANYDEFISLLKNRKNTMTNIKQLRDLWTNNVVDEKAKEFNRVFRIIRQIIIIIESKYFLQKQSVSYVYNSRISNATWHLKYRQNLLRALKDPENFKYIKEI